MTFVSYAQNYEDVMLARALAGVYGTLGAWELGVLPPAEALAKARAAATRALAR